MATNTEMDVVFSSDCGRTLQTEALNLIDQIIVSVGEGEDNKKFPVHEAVIRKSSRFFDNAMKPEWITARPEPRTVDLIDDSSEIFSIYLHWLYFKQFPTVKKENGKKYNPEYILVSDCYALATKIMDINFQNASLVCLCDAMENQPFYDRRIPGSGPLRRTYAVTMAGSPARRLLVDICAEAADESWIEYFTDDLPHEFVLDFSKALLLKKCTGRSRADKRS